ncbi:MAG: hypothetical protein KDK69_03270 [Chlamydiia bacterium]|nr:hypothetical protein [Chlamydiia bacterium]
MTFFPEPLRPSEGRKEEHLIVDPIEADKKAKENGADWQLPEEKKKSAMYGALLTFINKLTSFFTRNEGDNLETVSQDEMVNGVQALKEIFHSLKATDQSENSKFCQHFSEVWHILYQGLQILSRTKRKAYINVPKLIALIHDMDHYPPNEDHKLGFYLGNYAGESWLPLPFRDILKKLYTDHRVNQHNSTLSKWLDLITEILQG